MRDQNMQNIDRSVHCRIHAIASASYAMTGTKLHSAGSIGIGIIGTGEITCIMRPAFSASTEARIVAVADVNITCSTTEHADKLETKEMTP